MQEVVVNGERRTIASGMTVLALLEDLGLDPTQVAVERNREIVPRAQYPATVLVAGDTVEVVTFVGGG
jgi:thiamine biosynthesis protein ThiS